MDLHRVRIEIDNDVAVLTLNRPEVMNALTYDMAQGLGDLFEAAQADDDIRALVLTGAGKAFSTGADLTGKGSARKDAHTPLGMRISTFCYSRMVNAIPRTAATTLASISERSGVAPSPNLATHAPPMMKPMLVTPSTMPQLSTENRVSP